MVNGQLSTEWCISYSISHTLIGLLRQQWKELIRVPSKFHITLGDQIWINPDGTGQDPSKLSQHCHHGGWCTVKATIS